MTKKLVLAILSVVAVAAALGTTTFAWFSLSAAADISGLDVQVEAGDGIQLSVDGLALDNDVAKNWRTSYNKASFQADLKLQDANYDFDKLAFTALTTKATGAKIDNLMHMDGTAANAGAPLKVEKNVKYLEFNLDIKYENSGIVGLGTDKKVVALTQESGFLPKDTLSTWVADEAFTSNGLAIAKSDVLSVSAANAARLSMQTASLTAGVPAIGNDLVIEQKAKTNAAGEPGNSELGNGAALDLLSGAHQYYNLKNASTPLTAGQVTAAKANLGGLKVHTVDSVTPSNSSLPAKDTTVVGTEDFVIIRTDDAATSVDANGWSRARVVVRVWLEGWDFECYDAILRDFFSIKLVFRMYSI